SFSAAISQEMKTGSLLRTSSFIALILLMKTCPEAVRRALSAPLTACREGVCASGEGLHKAGQARGRHRSTRRGSPRRRRSADARRDQYARRRGFEGSER